MELFCGPQVHDEVALLKDMDCIVDATHTKILKPDPRAYVTAANGLGADKAGA